MPGLEETVLDVLLVIATAAWVVALTYAGWRLFEKLVVRPLRDRGTTSGRPHTVHRPAAVLRGGRHLDQRTGRTTGSQATFHRAR